MSANLRPYTSQWSERLAAGHDIPITPEERDIVDRACDAEEEMYSLGTRIADDLIRQWTQLENDAIARHGVHPRLVPQVRGAIATAVRWRLNGQLAHLR